MEQRGGFSFYPPEQLLFKALRAAAPAALEIDCPVCCISSPAPFTVLHPDMKATNSKGDIKSRILFIICMISPVIK